MSQVTLTLTTQLRTLAQEAWSKRDANPKEARLLAEELRTRAEDSFPLGVGCSLTVSSFLHYRAGRFAEGLSEALVALEMLEGAKDLEWLSRIYNNLGLLYDGLGERPQAMSWLLKQLELAQQLGNKQQEATAIHDLGFMAPNPEQARGYFYKARELFREAGDGWGVVLSCINLAEGYTAQGNYKQALHLANEAMNIKDHEGAAVEKGYINQALGGIHAAQGQFEKALEYYHSSLDFTHEGLGDVNLEPTTHLDIGKTHQKMGRFDKALEYLEKGLQIAERMDFSVAIYTAHQALSDHYKVTGNFEKALEHFETFHRLKENIFNSESEQKLRAMEVIHRTETAKKEAALQQRKNAELREHIERLEKLNAQVKALSISDPLTGLYNRRYLFDYLAGLEDTQALSVAVLDIDHFKKINDTYTHFVGDDVLRGAGTLLGAFLRTTDIAARFGGEEFVIVFGHTNLDQAVLACERLRQTVEEHVWTDKHPELRATISVGIAAGVATNYEALLQTADKKLFEAKNLGRNRVVS
jgi:diguanylate cyclase (GGDEF)-like protein